MKTAITYLSCLAVAFAVGMLLRWASSRGVDQRPACKFPATPGKPQSLVLRFADEAACRRYLSTWHLPAPILLSVSADNLSLTAVYSDKDARDRAALMCHH